MGEQEYRTMGVFSLDSIDRGERLLDLLTIVANEGPDREAIHRAYNRTMSYGTFEDVSLSRLDAMSLLDVSGDEIHLGQRGQRFVDGEIEALLEGLCVTFVGFYETMAILDAAPTPIGTIRGFLNGALDLDWTQNREPKRRVDWLRDLELARMLSGSNEYELTDAGHNQYETLQSTFGQPAIATLFGADSTTESGADSTDNNPIEVPTQNTPEEFASDGDDALTESDPVNTLIEEFDETSPSEEIESLIEEFDETSPPEEIESLIEESSEVSPSEHPESLLGEMNTEESDLSELIEAASTEPSSLTDSSPTSDSDPDQSHSLTTAGETNTSTPPLPIIESETRKIVSTHVNKTDKEIERYNQTVDQDTAIESVEWLSEETYPCASIRYWETQSHHLDAVGGLTRGDAILFHHSDQGYMTICQVLAVQERAIDDTDTELDRRLLFESAHTVGVDRDAIFDLRGWTRHPMGRWARLDGEDALHEQYGSPTEFIATVQGESVFEYWNHDNWGLAPNVARKLDRQLRRKGQAIIYGPPGTGKTFSAEQFAKWWTGKQAGTVPTEYQTESVTLHPAYAYEDFMEGYTIVTDGATGDDPRQSESDPEGHTTGTTNSPYGLKNGQFKALCRKAARVRDATDDDQSVPRYVLVIDELNRGNVPQILGESITLLERNKRGTHLRLSHSGQSFEIPKNVFIIATMNTADQSITRLDAAIRRRFASIQLTPEYDNFYSLSDPLYPDDRATAAALVSSERADAEALLAASLLAVEIINKRIVQIPSLGKGKRIGHSYLYPDSWKPTEIEIGDDTALADVWRYDILPLLEEYFYQNIDTLDEQVFTGEARFIDDDSKDIIDFSPDQLRDELRTFVLDNQELLDVEFPE